jgi:hypothetical protein
MRNQSERAISRATVLLVLVLVLVTGCADSAGMDSGSAAKRGDASAEPCPHGKLDGSYAIMSSGDAAAIAACTEISKDLTVSGNKLSKLSLPKLKAIGGALNVTDATALTRFDFSSLTTVAKELLIDANPVLSTFSVPVLDNCETLLVTNNPKLKDFDLAKLTRASHVGAQGDDALTKFELPKVKSIGTFVVNQNAKLTTIRFESLMSIEADGFIIQKNPVLATLDMPMLKTLVGDLLIMDNPMLPSCQIAALAAQVEGPPVPVGAFGNDDAATCP